MTAAVERKAIESSVAYYDRLARESHGLSGGFTNELLTVLAAARKHLATLPAPPKTLYVLSATGRTGRFTVDRDTKEDVLGLLRDFVESDYDDIHVTRVSA